MKRYYVFRTGEAGDTFDADYEPDALGKWVKFEDAQAEIDRRDARVTELDAALAQLQLHYHVAAELHSGDDLRIAELEKQAAIDKTLLALADARINRELRDDFAGRAMQGALSSGSFSMLGHPERAKFAYTQADEMLKAKGGE